MLNVLSLFDGISGGQVAINRLGIKYYVYYASEIDKYAIKVTQKNYQNTIQLGDVRNIKGSDLPKIDLLIGGSPCQGFSFAGKQLNFNDERSKLFFEFVRLLREVKPRYFLLENVVMKKEYQDVISQVLGVEPTMINSSLVSGQSRKRLYWTNIKEEYINFFQKKSGIPQPQDKGILLKDILQSDEFIYQKPRGFNKGGLFKDKSPTLTSNHFQENNIIIIDNINPSGKGQNGNVFDVNGKSPTLTAIQGGNQEAKISLNNLTWRKLTPVECERLQTFPDNYTEGISNSQRYKALGNSFTVDVIKHILSYMECIG